jgi:Tfp pilus assembly protein PilO
MKNIISLIIIIVSIAAIFLYLMPEYSTLGDLRTTKTSYESALASAKQLQSVRDTLLNSYNAISDTDKANLNKMIPPNFDSVKLVSDISTDAAQYGMSISQVKISNVNAPTNASRPGSSGVATSTYRTIQIAFASTGSYTSLVSFIKDLESSIELLDLEKLTIESSPSVTPGGKETLGFGVTLNTYAAN